MFMHRTDTASAIGQPYTVVVADYDWRDTYPVVEVHEDGTVGRITAVVPASAVPEDLHGVTIAQGRVVSTDSAWDNDALASIADLERAGFEVE